MEKQYKGKLSHVLQAIISVPLLLFGIGIMFLAAALFGRTMNAQVEETLSIVANTAETMLEANYPGDYKLVGDTSLELYKGDKNITREYSIVDQLKEDSGMDITLFYQDTRILTTLVNSKEERVVGTGAPEKVIKDVLQSGEAHFYSNISIFNERYYAYYRPLKQSDGTVVGILFVGKPMETIKASLNRAIYPLALAVLLVMIVIVFCMLLYTRKFSGVLDNLHKFMEEVSKGNLNAELSPSVTTRNDEFGDIGRSVINMQSALRRLIETDTLTELFNRRSGTRKIKGVIAKAEETGTPFCVSIGDIDFFKKVNDTYGHEAGDVVLKAVSNALREHMLTCGFVARWGGEEFLLVFDHNDLDDSTASLNALLEKIRALEIPYGEQVIKVTMSFGVTTDPTATYDKLLRDADTNLYVAKTNGRNRVVRD